MKNISVRIVFAIAMVAHIVGSPVYMHAARSLEIGDEQTALEKKISAVNKYKQRLAAAKEESVAFASLLGDTPYPYIADAKELYEQYDKRSKYNLEDLVRIVAEYRRLNPEQTHFATENEKDASYKKMHWNIVGLNTEVITELVLSGSPVNYEYADEDEYTKHVLKLVVDNGDIAQVPLLLAAGVDITYCTGEYKRDVLAYAALANQVKIVQILLAAGAGILDGDGSRSNAADNALKEVLNECWCTDDGETPEGVIVAKCNKFARVIRLLVMANLETSEYVDTMPKRLQQIFAEARDAKPMIKKEVDKQDWELPDLTERKVLETLLPIPAELQNVVRSFVGVSNEIVSDVIEVARQRRLLAEKGVKINMQWAEKWAQKIEEESAAAMAAIKPRKPRKKEAGVVSQWLNKLASGWSAMGNDIRLCL